MPKTTAKNVAQATTDDAARRASAVALVHAHEDAVRIGMRLREERDNRNAQAVSLMSRVDAMEKLHAIVKYLDDSVYSNCDDKRQAEAHHICEMTLLPALERGMASEQNSREYAQALSDVLSGVALLVQRGPSSVRGETEATFALQGYVSMLRGMRGVALDISHTTLPDKLATIRAAEQKRAAKMADAVNNVRALLDAPVVDADK